MKIIGHRGMAGKELENTLSSLKAAADSDVWAIEFDVRLTHDDQLVVFHDADLVRLTGSKDKIADLTLKQVQKIALSDGSHIPTLEEALDVLENRRCIIELKGSGGAQQLVNTLKDFPETDFYVASFKTSELAIIKYLDQSIRLFLLERTKPFDVFHLAKELEAHGVGLNYWLLNPLTYRLLKRAGLLIYVYTIDSPARAWFVNKLYPDVMICTNYPERFLDKK